MVASEPITRFRSTTGCVAMRYAERKPTKFLSFECITSSIRFL